jgi:hypothetical protein
LRVTTRGKSPVRSCRTPGSVRGVLGNWHPYRDLSQHQSLVNWCGFLCAHTVEWARQWPLAQHDEVQGANWQAGGDHP